MQILGCSSDASTNWLIPSVPEIQDELLAVDFGSEIPVGKYPHPHLSLKYMIINNNKPRKQAKKSPIVHRHWLLNLFEVWAAFTDIADSMRGKADLAHLYKLELVMSL